MERPATTSKEGVLTNQELGPDSKSEILERDEIKALFQRHNDELVRYLVGRLKSRDEAVEVAQEAYVRLLRLDDTSTIGFLRAFLFRTATNIAIDRQRRRGRAKAYVEHEQADADAQVFEFTPERQVAGQQSLNRVIKCIESLPPKCRYAFLEFKFRHRSYDDIAGEMGITTSMVRKYVLRAMVHCTEQLGDELSSWSR